MASSEANLKRDDGDFWASGKIFYLINPSKFRTLENRLRHASIVFGKSASGTKSKVSAWSPPAFWTMGILTPADWISRSIRLDEKM